MRHRKSGNKLGRNSTLRKATIRDIAKATLVHQRVRTTKQKAKEARKLVDRLITLGKKDTLTAKRKAFSILCDHKLVSNLFSKVARRFNNRVGGYTRIIPLSFRRGDYANLVYLELTEKEIIQKEKRKQDRKKKTKKQEPVDQEKVSAKVQPKEQAIAGQEVLTPEKEIKEEVKKEEKKEDKEKKITPRTKKAKKEKTPQQKPEVLPEPKPEPKKEKSDKADSKPGKIISGLRGIFRRKKKEGSE